MTSLKKNIFLMIPSAIVCISIIIGLNIYETRFHHHKNGFKRIFPSHIVENAKQLNLRFNSYYISGVSKTAIYLSNKTAPSLILITNYQLKDSQIIYLHLQTNSNIIPSAIKTVIDSPNIYMMEGITPALLIGNLNSLYMTKEPSKNIRFNAASPISKKNYIFRSYDARLKKNIILKFDGTKNDATYKIDILDNQGDGVFSTDGLILYDKKIKKLLYIYYYQNKFVCLDTSLNTIYKAHSIDTVSHAQLHIDSIPAENAITFSSPPVLVNKTSCVDGAYLYINSNLAADNEEIRTSRYYSVIDIYNIKNGRYKYSFYIPENNHGKFKSFRVYNNKLVALYDHSLMTFQINIK